MAGTEPACHVSHTPDWVKSCIVVNPIRHSTRIATAYLESWYSAAMTAWIATSIAKHSKATRHDSVGSSEGLLASD
jgi:hypothetical protein